MGKPSIQRSKHLDGTDISLKALLDVAFKSHAFEESVSYISPSRCSGTHLTSRP